MTYEFSLLFSDNNGDPLGTPAKLIFPEGSLIDNLDGTYSVAGFGDTVTTQKIILDTTYTPSGEVAGTIYWNSEEETVDIVVNSNVILQSGQEILINVKNQTGSTITNGTPVMFAGTLGNSGRILIQKAIADGSLDPSYILGIATEDIPNGEDGKVTWFGKVRGIDTDGSLYGETWADGEILYVSPTTAGYLTKTKPNAPNRVIQVAAVINSSNTGSLMVRPTWNPKLTELDDVDGTDPTVTGQIMTWNETAGVFEFVKNINDYSLTTHNHSGVYEPANANIQSHISDTNNPHSTTKAQIGLGSVTNNAQTRAAIVPNTVPSAGQILAGNAGGTAYAPVSMSGDATLASTGAITVSKSTNLKGGNNTTLLGALPYQSNTDTTSLLSPNTTTTKQFLSQTGTGTNGATPAWSAVSKSDVGLGNVENTALSTWAGSTNITTLGTIATGTWSGTTIGVTKGGTGTTTQFTAGSVVFAGASGVYSQDNANFFWDDTNKRLGIGRTNPISRVHIDTTSYTSQLIVQRAGGLGTSISADQSTVGFNAYYDSTAVSWKSLGAGYTGQLWLNASTGDFELQTSPSVAAGAAQTFTTRFKVTNAGGIYFPAFTTVGSIPFIGTGGQLLDDPTQLHWDNTSNRLGIGNSAPAVTLDVTGIINSQGGLQNTTGNIANIGTGYNGVASYVYSDTASPYSLFLRARGTQATPTETLNNYYLGAFGFRGYTGSAFFTYDGARFAALAEQSGSAGYGTSLIFSTNPLNGVSDALERMRITSAGNVGIGASPSSILHVTKLGSTAWADASFTGASTYSYTAYSHELQLTNTADDVANSYAGLFFRAGTTTGASIAAGRIAVVKTGASTADFVFALRNGTNMTEKARVNASGSLLVGTTTDSARLTVKSGGATSASFAAHIENSAGTTLATVRNDGVASFANNVGIGTDAPINRLHLEGTVSANQIGIYVKNNGATGTFPYVSFGVGGSTVSVPNWVNAGFFESAADNGLHFGAFSGDVRFFANTSRATNFIIKNGTANVGIGIDAPTARLNVKGSGNTSATNTALFENSDGTDILTIRDDKAIILPNTTFTGGNAGVVYKGSQKLIHDFTYGNNGTVTPDGFNLFLGDAGNFTMGSTATSTTESSRNVGISYGSLFSLTTGYQNVGLGASTLRFNTTGYQNMAIGYASLYTNVSGNHNVGVGNATLNASLGNYNTAIGSFALFVNSTCDNNVAIGYQAGRYIANGSTNSTSCTESVLLGSNTKVNASGETNQIVIGYNVTGLGSNTCIIGNSSITKTVLLGNLGCGTTTPGAKAHFLATTEQLRLGYDASVYVSNTVSSTGDLTITCPTDKTVVLGETVWLDIDFPLVIRSTGVGIPTLTTLQGNITAPSWAVNDYNVCEGQELIHMWKEGTACYWHLHLITNGLDATNRYVRFEVEYCWATADGTLSAATTIDSGDILIAANTTTKTHKIVSIGNFTPTGAKIGTQVYARLKRIASTGTAPTNNPWVTMLQMHIECDTLGSRQIGTK